MRDTAAGALGETGLELADVAASAMRVFSGVLGTEAPEDLPPGWLAVARAAAAEFDGQADDDRAVPVGALAARFRLAYARAADADLDGLPPIEEMDPPIRLAWEAVVRHLANVCNFDPEDARRITQHEQRITEMCRAKLPAAPR